jgi:pimeloyl-ACP methyl ester carboxylesterase
MRQMIPLLIHRAATEGIETIAPYTRQIAAVYDTISAGAYLSVVCSEDAPRVTRDGERSMRELFGGFGAAGYDACAVWPSRRIDPDTTWRSDVPVLLISGDADPATTREAGEEARRTFPNSLHVVAAATAHFPILPGCVANLARTFLDTASVEGLDPSCASQIQWTPFVLAPR